MNTIFEKSGYVAAGQRLWRWICRLAKVEEAARHTRLTKEEALEIARRDLMGDGELYLPGAGVSVENGCTVWRVVTHAGKRGGHSSITIDDETGDVIATHHVDH